ncbi:hypothetical protein C8J57DRAFT_1543925 [Mycena rebaudengoi]|nr:hypothetical protein C8J57DRAFT_1543925 [Mycena rebaudengoi]
MGGISCFGLFHFVPNPTFAGNAIVNANAVKVKSLQSREKTEAVFRKYRARGYRIRVDYTNDHTCGVSLDCPCTVRTTLDSGCLQLLFPDKPYGISVLPSRASPSDIALAWSLGGQGCTSGSQFATGNIPIAFPYSKTHQAWRRRILRSIHRVGTGA